MDQDQSKPDQTLHYERRADRSKKKQLLREAIWLNVFGFAFVWTILMALVCFPPIYLNVMGQLVPNQASVHLRIFIAMFGPVSGMIAAAAAFRIAYVQDFRWRFMVISLLAGLICAAYIGLCVVIMWLFSQWTGRVECRK